MWRNSFLICLILIAGCGGSQDSKVQILPKGTLGALTVGHISVLLPVPISPSHLENNPELADLERGRSLMQSMMEPTLTSSMRTAMSRELQRHGFTSPKTDGCLPVDAPLLCATILEANTSFTSAAWGSHTTHQVRTEWEVLARIIHES